MAKSCGFFCPPDRWLPPRFLAELQWLFRQLDLGEVVLEHIPPPRAARNCSCCIRPTTGLLGAWVFWIAPPDNCGGHCSWCKRTAISRRCGQFSCGGV